MAWMRSTQDFFGRVSELLLDIWINTNHISYTEYPFVYMEKSE